MSILGIIIGFVVIAVGFWLIATYVPATPVFLRLILLGLLGVITLIFVAEICGINLGGLGTYHR
jgi:hypothetical protein